MLTVNLEKRGDFYMAFHQDARDIAGALGDVTVTTCGGADAVGLPAHSLVSFVESLNEKQVAVKINPPLT